MRRLLITALLIRSLIALPLLATQISGPMLPGPGAKGYSASNPAFVNATPSPANWSNVAGVFTLTYSITAGNTYVVDFYYRSDLGSIVTVTDNQATICAVIFSVTGIGGNRGHAAYVCPTVASGVTSIILTFTAGVNASALAVQYSNLGGTVDTATSDNGRGSSPTTSNSITPAGSLNGILWCGGGNNSVAPVVTNDGGSTGSGWTDRGPSGSSNNDGSLNTGGEKFVTSTTSSYTCEIDSASDVNNVNLGFIH